MTPDVYERVASLLERMAELPHERRATFLDEHCGGDRVLREEVMSLLEVYERTGTFVADTPIVARGAFVAPLAAAEKGSRVGAYLIIKLLGVGGMGEVYLALDTRLGRKVALKFLPSELAGDDQRRARFDQEARAASALNHPNICVIHEVGEIDDGRHYIAMEYIEGDTLRERLAKGQVDIDEALDVAVQVASALAVAHDAGVVHRDIKPENLMVRSDGIVKVVDFGLARLTTIQETVGPGSTRNSSMRTGSGIVMGTARYMSPEQARGVAVDARTDVWSLGVVLYETIAGCAPYMGDSTSDVIVSILQGDPTPLADIVPEVPAELQRIVGKALRKSRDERYRDVKTLQSELKALQRKREIECAGRARQIETRGSDSRAQDGVRPPGRPLGLGFRAVATFVSKRRFGLLGVVSLVAVFAGVAGLTPVVLRRLRAPATAAHALSRLTFDAGLQCEPTWSPDGRYIAFTSDRGGNCDIWVQLLGNSEAVQVTHSPAQDYEPDWSPDGTQIVFRSERDGGGLFVAPASGGYERKIAALGYRPRWSPDGSRILFVSGLTWIGATHVYLASLDGAEPREILVDGPKFADVSSIIWHPDGRRVTLVGRYNGGGWSLWTVATDGSAPVESEFYAHTLEHTGALWNDGIRWAPNGGALFIEATARGVKNLWKYTIDPETLQAIGDPERMTTGLGIDTDIALSPDGQRLAFTTRTDVVRGWTLPFDARAGNITGTGQPITTVGRLPLGLRISPDGKQVSYFASQAGTDRSEIWRKSLVDGSESTWGGYVDTPFQAPAWSHDSRQAAFGGVHTLNPENTKFEYRLVALPASGGDEVVIDSGASQELAWDWSDDGKYVLASLDADGDGHFGTLAELPIRAAPNARREMRVITSHPTYGIFQGAYSPNNRWVCFAAVESNSIADLFLVSSAGGEWTPIARDGSWSDKPRWAPDGKTIYYVSNRGSLFLNVWGIRFDPIAGKPVGKCFPVTSFENPGRCLWSAPGPMEISLTKDRLVLPIMEATGSVWMLDNVDK